jgi:hypothetical protein
MPQAAGSALQPPPAQGREGIASRGAPVRGASRRLPPDKICKSEIWALERELRKAFSCSSTNAGVPGVGAIGRFGSWTPAGSFGVNFGVAG